jgi:lysophospholipase L1-like esterase
MNMNRVLMILLVLLFSFMAVLSAEPLRVACVGNSITAGAGISDAVNDAYPGQLQKLLGENYVVGNFGNSGRTMLKNGDYPLWVEKEFTNALAMNPNIVIILLGTNDSKPYNWIYKDEYVPDYLAMIDTFKTLPANPQIYICKPPPAFSVVYDIRDSVITADIIPMIDQLATLRDVAVIDFYTACADKRSLFPDDIHPNAEGSWEMAKVVYKKLTGIELTQIQDVDVARGKPVTAAALDNCSSPEALTDGDRATKWSCMSSGSAVVDLGTVESIDCFQTDFGVEGQEFGQYYKIDVSIDSNAWSTVVDKSALADSSLRIAVDNIEPVDARYVRLTPIGAVTAVSEAVGAYDFRVLRAAAIHAPVLFIDDIVPGPKFTRFNYYTLPCQNSGYLKVASSSDPANPFTDVKGYRLAAPQKTASTVRPDKGQRYLTKAYYDGVEVISADTVTVDWSISAVESKPELLTPHQYLLQQNYPNPFNPTTTINFELPEAGHITLKVYNLQGVLLKTLASGQLSKGCHTFAWDGTNESGVHVSAGPYLYRLETPSMVLTKKMIFLK